MPGKGTIAVATSIPPTLVRQDGGRDAPDYQMLCIRSWIANGFRVISVNHAEEIEALARRYPDVTFVATSRDARAWTGRRNPYIADLLLALAEADEPVLGLINSDLLFETSAAWAAYLPSRVPQTMVIAHRYNTHSLSNGALRRFQGLDCFFFDRAMALCALENAMPFAIGAPWWDYWLPCMAILNERDLAIVDRPAILHLFHKTAYSEESQAAFGRELAQAVIREAAKRAEPPAYSILKPMLLEMADPSLAGDALKRKFAQFCRTVIGEFREGMEVWQAPANLPVHRKLEEAFSRFDQRLAAGEAFQQAKALLQKKPASDVGPDLIACLDQAPDDPDVRMIQGEIALRSGNLTTARDFFSRAAELLPNAAAPFHGQGIALRTAGEHEEALSCFRRALEIEPTYQRSGIAAAKLLWDMNRQKDALHLLDGILARHPGLDQLARLRDDYRLLTNM